MADSNNPPAGELARNQAGPTARGIDPHSLISVGLPNR